MRAALQQLDRLLAEHKADNLRFDSAINNISQGLCFFDGRERLIVCNDRYAEMYNLPREVMRPGITLREVVEHRYQVGTGPDMPAEQYLAWRHSCAAASHSSDTVTDLRDGRTFAIHHQPMPDGGWVATHEDITERRRHQALIEGMAHSDPLTGLSNRVRYRERLEEVLKQVGPEGAVGLLCIDLDRFKAVNDTLGHPIGDQLLCAAAKRLRQSVRQGDLVARLGGDEFAIIQFDNAPQPAAATSLAARLVHEFTRPFEIGEHQLLVGASVGVAISPTDGTDPDDLLKKADLALYDAKMSGRGTFSLFRPPMHEIAQSRRLLGLDLRQAEAREELELHYQPIMSLHTGKIVAFEALLRWRHPEHGLVMPDTFIPMAEETGLIEPLGAWVLRKAFLDAARWPADIGVAVNLSPVQVKSASLTRLVREALQAAALAPNRVDLEITESVLLSENSVNLATLHGLRALGVRICLDDFGVGYSSLSYLRSFPFKKVKIDRSFVRDVVEKSEAAAIVRAIASLCRSLDMSVTAEGVETDEQLENVQRIGCDEAQGYLIGMPRPAADLGLRHGQSPARAPVRGHAAPAGAETGVRAAVPI
ncbi:MAG: EAL domain-containing protein [Lautropia sp.]|nr:EAL domain-containing protein [Lautropia sp.]